MVNERCVNLSAESEHSLIKQLSCVNKHPLLDLSQERHVNNTLMILPVGCSIQTFKQIVQCFWKHVLHIGP